MTLYLGLRICGIIQRGREEALYEPHRSSLAYVPATFRDVTNSQHSIEAPDIDIEVLREEQYRAIPRQIEFENLNACAGVSLLNYSVLE